MASDDLKFPGWAGPLVGAGIGAFIGARAAWGEDGLHPAGPVIGAVCGALAGCILWVADLARRKPRPRDDEEDDRPPRRRGDRRDDEDDDRPQRRRGRPRRDEEDDY